MQWKTLRNGCCQPPFSTLCIVDVTPPIVHQNYWILLEWLQVANAPEAYLFSSAWTPQRSGCPSRGELGSQPQPYKPFRISKIDDFLAAGTRCVEGCLVGTGQVDTMLRFAHAWAVPIFRRSSHLSFAKLPASLGQAISVMFAALINTQVPESPWIRVLKILCCWE